MGIAFVATAFCVAFASCGDKDDDNSTPAGGSVVPDEYVDLGLPSGTKWKATNETNQNNKYNFYVYGEAMATFGSQLPTKEQYEELFSLCTYTWDDNKGGTNFVSTVNGKSIFLPAAGYYDYWASRLRRVNSCGCYWSSTPGDTYDVAWGITINSDGVGRGVYYGDDGFSVRLVQN